MAGKARRVVTGHDANGKSVVIADGLPPQDHPMQGPAVGADFFEIWNSPEAIPTLASLPEGEPTARPFTIMPSTGHLIRIIDIYPPHMGGQRTVMHRTRTLDYAIVIEGEIVLVLSDSEVTLGPGEVVVQRGTDHAWENRTEKPAQMVFVLVDGAFDASLKAVAGDLFDHALDA